MIVIVIVPAMFVGVWLGWQRHILVRERVAHDNYCKITVGMTKAQVWRQLGWIYTTRPPSTSHFGPQESRDGVVQVGRWSRGSFHIYVGFDKDGIARWKRYSVHSWDE